MSVRFLQCICVGILVSAASAQAQQIIVDPVRSSGIHYGGATYGGAMYRGATYGRGLSTVYSGRPVYGLSQGTLQAVPYGYRRVTVLVPALRIRRVIRRRSTMEDCSCSSTSVTLPTDQSTTQAYSDPQPVAPAAEQSSQDAATPATPDRAAAPLSDQPTPPDARPENNGKADAEVREFSAGDSSSDKSGTASEDGDRDQKTNRTDKTNKAARSEADEPDKARKAPSKDDQKQKRSSKKQKRPDTKKAPRDAAQKKKRPDADRKPDNESKKKPRPRSLS